VAASGGEQDLPDVRRGLHLAVRVGGALERVP
jgi:hypothetical protein